MQVTEKKGARFAFVHAQWHEDIVQNAWESFSAEMARQGHGCESIDVVKVPGVFEIPICAQKLAKSGQYAAIVLAAGHHQFLAMGEQGIKAFGQIGAVVYDVKSILPMGAADGRL